MSPQEMEDMFDVLYNNITSNLAPGLNSYEKSVFLTKALNEILKNYFNPKGNKYQEGFDGNAKRLIDFSMLTKVASVLNLTYTYTEAYDTNSNPVTDGSGNATYTRTSTPDVSLSYLYTQAYDSNGSPIEGHYVRVSNIPVTGFASALYDTRENSRSATLPSNIMMIINERVQVTRENTTVDLVVIPVTFDEYNRLMSKPYKRPLKYLAWRLINSDSVNKSDIIVGPNDIITNYTIRYIKRPNPIILADLDGLSIEGSGNVSPCELDPILHEEILQRAVELAKTAWAGTLEELASTLLNISSGQRSE